jgi:hypothetical protein
MFLLNQHHPHQQFVPARQTVRRVSVVGSVSTGNFFLLLKGQHTTNVVRAIPDSI